jgi:hypothetical protein
MWQAEGSGKVKRNRGLKIGVTCLTTVREMPVPVVTLEQRVKFAILCAKRVCHDVTWNAWADAWLSGHDRTADAAYYAAARAVDAAYYAAIRAARAADAADAAYYAVDAAAYAYADADAARAVHAAAYADADLVAIAEEACS